MKKYYNYIGLFFLSLAIVSCDDNEVYPPIEAEAVTVALNTSGVDFSKYVAVGASFTAGFTDNALFMAGQQNSFPNILSSKFALDGGGEFKQPLMNDNIGGFVLNGQILPTAGPRLYFNGAGPAVLNAVPTTDANASIAASGPYNNVGIPGAKSFHLTINGYATLNPYFGRIATSATQSVLEYISSSHNDATFFTLSEIGGNDVLGYAITGGDGTNVITPTATFDASFDAILGTLTSNGAKGVVGNVPYITSLSHFTTVPYNPLDPTSNSALAAQIPLLNTVYGAINQIYVGVGEPERAIIFSETETNPVVIFDEDATDLTVAIATTLGSSPTFVPFVQSLGLPTAAAPLVAQLLGQQYGKARAATENDLFVLPSSSVIGTVNTTHAGGLIAQSGGLLPATLAGQFSAEGVTLPLADKWVLTPQEQDEIKTATDAYNAKIKSVVDANENVELVDLNAILQQAATVGIQFDNYLMNTDLVFGGLISLDGVHLTARGYALMANKILEAIDTGFGSNFTEATDGLARADDYPTNYSPALN